MAAGTRLAIERLGAQGDGFARTECGPVHVPFTLPGETVTAAVERDRAALISVLEPSPLRIEPKCRHFSTCGGCALQHVEEGAYRAFKRDRVVVELARAGVEAEVADLVPCAPASRRRVVLAARRTERGMLLGFNRAFSHEIVDIAECPVALPAIMAALDDIRAAATLVAATPRAFRISVSVTASGLDLAFIGSGKLDEGARRAASAHALKSGFARLSVDGEIVVEPAKPLVMAGNAAVLVPPAGFLQAVAETEAKMAAAVAGHLGRARRVVDLFAGSGAFALRLAVRAQVHAVEGDAAALAALDRAFRSTSGLKKVTGERRDLFRRPLTPKELGPFDGLVFDPPRAGAEEQSKQIARSAVPLVAAVSCNPVTLARDLNILVAGGYEIVSITPFDQFLWSPHVETVALLRRSRPGRRK
ncbi:MAG: class I SAM-dependent RNA methyltransferase [Rhizobiaceae bacterium]|nr:class I SAM-dependent RNA methyltransferase [Rhizobiaceae bacterium]MCV0405640.1 class I SAM-dependent RNA methyltransferase [Rhizobiaceae bacterium]